MIEPMEDARLDHLRSEMAIAREMLKASVRRMIETPEDELKTEQLRHHNALSVAADEASNAFANCVISVTHHVLRKAGRVQE